MDINYQLPQIQRFPGLSEYTRQASLQALAPPPALSNSAMNTVNQQRQNLFKQYQTQQNKNQLLGQAVSSLTGQLSNQVSEGIFGTDTELGQAMGNLFSTGINTAGDQVVNNIFKGESLMNGMGQSVGSSLAGAGAGMAANYIGKGISSLGGNSKLSRGIGAGFATGAGTLGGTMASNLVKGQSLFNGIKGMNTANLVGLGASIVGSGLQAAFGPSKEYGGTYGNITKGMDTAYDLIQGAAGFIPGVGTAVSGLMALNKGLSNVFGSTSGMTRQDAILGSAFMPATVKWLNMAGAKTTDKFRNQSWQNQERTNTFMQNGFGDLGEKFDKARRESGKTYGTFSRHAYNKAQGNVNFANDAFNKILDMADDEEIRRIRSEYMTSINNQRYAQDITGGFRPLYRGKEGMKIPEINHNFGQRLLSGAALIDNKQMILSAQSGNKIFATNSRGDSYYLSPSALTSDEVNVTVPETFITANPDDVARGNAQRWWKEHSNVHNEKGLKQVSPEFDLITLSPLVKPIVNAGLRSTGRMVSKAGKFMQNSIDNTARKGFKQVSNKLGFSKVPGTYYHGSPRTGLKELIPTDNGVYLASTKNSAKRYGGLFEGTGSVYKVENVDLGNKPLQVNGYFLPNGLIPSKQLPQDVLSRLKVRGSSDAIANAAQQAGYTSVTFKNVLDQGRQLGIRSFVPSWMDQTVVFDKLTPVSESKRFFTKLFE